MKLGFIGCGNMARAIIKQTIASEFLKPEDIIAFDINAESLNAAIKTLGIRGARSNLEVVDASEMLILAVKPQYYEAVISQIRPAAADRTAVSLAPGKTLQWLEAQFENPNQPIVRTMPNTPVMVGEGMTAICANQNVSRPSLDKILSLFKCCGKTELVEQSMMDAVVAVSGSSPAYVFMLIEAMADAAVMQGMPRTAAITFAAQSVLGSAKMVLETDMHPAQLKDMVCSPGGTTIAAVHQLEKSGFRSAVMQAMKDCAEKSASL